jgi:hypothetical protein
VDWDTLTRLVAGDVVVAGSPGYDAVRTPAMARFHDVRPAAIVRCRTPADASAAIGFARARRAAGLRSRTQAPPVSSGNAGHHCGFGIVEDPCSGVIEFGRGDDRRPAQGVGVGGE